MFFSLLYKRAVIVLAAFTLLLIGSGCGGGTSSVNAGDGGVTVTLTASPTTIGAGQSSTLSWTTTNATSATIDNGVGAVPVPSGTKTVTPSTDHHLHHHRHGRERAAGNGAGNRDAAYAGSLSSIKHVIFMLQENRSFDIYFGMLNPYRDSNGWNVGDDGKTYTVDGIDDKLSTHHAMKMTRARVFALQVQEHLRRRHDLGVAGKLRRRQSL